MTPCPRRTVPASRGCLSRIASSSVVLPHPFGPTRATFSPRSRTSVASSRSRLPPPESATRSPAPAHPPRRRGRGPRRGGRHRRENPGGVGGEDPCGGEGLGLPLEPLEVLDVEVVRRLVE